MARRHVSRPHRHARRITARGSRRSAPDIQRICRALISLASTEAERGTHAEPGGHAGELPPAGPGHSRDGGSADA